MQTKSMLILKWIVWIRTVWVKGIAWNRNVFDNSTVYSLLSCIVWNRTDYLYENGFGIKYSTKVDML